MSLYNAVCGNNPMFWLLTRVIETQGRLPPVPRFRDMYTREKDGRPQIVLYTRTGGGNRNEYHEQNLALTQHKLYVEDFDDSFDSTFANFVYEVPVAFQERVLRFHRVFSKHPKGLPPPVKFQRAMQEMEGKAEEMPFTQEDVREFEAVGREIVADLPERQSSIEEGISNKSFDVPRASP